MLRGGPGGRDAQGAGNNVELGTVHHLSDGDPETSPSHHHIPSNPMEDREEAGRLGFRAPWDGVIGYPAHVREIPHHCLQIGVSGA